MHCNELPNFVTFLKEVRYVKELTKKDSEYSVGCANGADTHNGWMFSTKE